MKIYWALLEFLHMFRQTGKRSEFHRYSVSLRMELRGFQYKIKETTHMSETKNKISIRIKNKNQISEFEFENYKTK